MWEVKQCKNSDVITALGDASLAVANLNVCHVTCVSLCASMLVVFFRCFTLNEVILPPTGLECLYHVCEKNDND